MVFKDEGQGSQKSPESLKTKVNEHFQKAWIPKQLLTAEICKEGLRV